MDEDKPHLTEVFRRIQDCGFLFQPGLFNYNNDKSGRQTDLVKAKTIIDIPQSRDNLENLLK